MEYCIRTLEPADMRAAMALTWKTFLEFEADEYPPEGVREFRDYIAVDAMRVRCQSGELLLWGCFLGSELVGVIATRPEGHISLLFVDKDHHRRGVARQLYQRALEDHLRRGGGPVITVNASPYGHAAYCRLGFSDMGKEQVVNGLRFTPMKHEIT